MLTTPCHCISCWRLNVTSCCLMQVPVILSHRPDNWRLLAGAYLLPPLVGTALRYGLVGPLLRRHRLRQVRARLSSASNCADTPQNCDNDVNVKQPGWRRAVLYGLINPLLRRHHLRQVRAAKLWQQPAVMQQQLTLLHAVQHTQEPACHVAMLQACSWQWQLRAIAWQASMLWQCCQSER